MSGFPLEPPIDARLTAPLELPATSTGHLTTEGGSTLDDGSGDATIAGTLGVDGDTTLSGTLAVTDGVTLDSTLGVTGATTLDSTLAVTGDITVPAVKSTGSTISAVTVPASGTALPTVTVDTLIYIVGGVITGITLNGDALPTSIPLIYQRPADSIVITYTTAPTDVWAQTL